MAYTRRTVTDGVTVMNKDLYDNLQDGVDALFNDIAPSETSPAESTHSIGDFIIYNNVLYSVKQAIAVEDALVVDTNIEAAKIGALLTALRSLQVLKFMGTITFSQLPTQDMTTGDTYNISDAFTTDNRFKEGADIPVAAGAEVSRTADGYWSVLAGSTVAGVKGDAEQNYRTGNVNITPTNIGLGNVGNFKAVSTVASQGLTTEEKSNAQANMGIPAVVTDLQLTTLTGTLLSSGWTLSSGVYTQTITVTGLGASDIAFVSANSSMSAADRDVVTKSKVACTGQAANSLTFEAAKEPTVNIPIVVIIQGTNL